MITIRSLHEHLLAAAEDLDLDLTHRQVGWIANRVAVHATRAVRGSNPNLTLSEMQHAILVGVASGETAQETADRIGRCLDTVKTHRRRLYAQLGARTAGQAVWVAMSLGLLRTGRPETAAVAGGDA